MKLIYKEGLLFTTIKINYNGKTAEIGNIVIDTGASYCIIEPSVIEDLGITFTKDDEVETFYGVNSLFNYVKRTVDSIVIDNITINKVNVYIGSVTENIDGLLGLDALINSGAIIDLKNMEIRFE